MTYGLYNLLLHLLLPLLPVVALWARWRGRRLGADLAAKLGASWRLPVVPRGAILVHAASVGETRAVEVLVRSLRWRHPGIPVVVTSGTSSGHQLARRIELADACVMLPLDYPWIIGPFLLEARPRMVVIAESEIWPNFLLWCRRLGVPVIYVNGRLSPRRAGIYSRLGRAYARVLAGVDLFLMQTIPDADRLRTMGVDPARMSVVGDLKADQARTLLGRRTSQEVRQDLGIGDDPLLVAGSTHAGEEELLLDALVRVRARSPRTRLLIAPRHLERVTRITELIASRGWRLVRRSEKRTAGEAEVLVLDTFGELAQIYVAATLSFVGGTMVTVGGHSVYEPAVFGKPVVIGPHDEECRVEADHVAACGGLIRVRSGEELSAIFVRLIEDEAERERVGAAAARGVEELGGALERTLELLEARLNL